jgi:hypothetical protein
MCKNLVVMVWTTGIVFPSRTEIIISRAAQVANRPLFVVVSLDLRRPESEVDTHFHLMLNLRIRGALSLYP